MQGTGTGRYRTSDLYYAAYLKVAAVPFIEAVREQGGRVVFVFEDSDGIRDLKNQYYGRNAKVVAMTYADEVKAMKALTFNA
ncbi:MAG: hypothetical protein EBT79_07515 [Actinobacteria bacterium]|nr:hypothetical protein [Actinomycetota bacterium]NBR67107.1 hypothetical protein [Actinomycetota bacterium]